MPIPYILFPPVSSGHLGFLLGLYSEVSEPAGERGHLHHHSDMCSGRCTHHIGSSACGYLSSVLHEVPQWHIQGISFPVAFPSSLLRSMLSERLIQPCVSIIIGVREKLVLHCLKTKWNSLGLVYISAHCSRNKCFSAVSVWEGSKSVI